MPDARGHDLITLATGAALAPAAMVLQSGAGVAADVATSAAAALVIGHVISGCLFSPDLDLDSAIDNRWGIFFFIWRPYTWAVPHRHFWSHGLIIPPLFRLLYFYCVVFVFLVGGAWLLGRLGIAVPDLHSRLAYWLRDTARDHPREVWAFLLGFITGGAAHTAADWLVTGGKRYLRLLGIRVTRDYHGHDRWQPRHVRRRSWGR